MFSTKTAQFSWKQVSIALEGRTLFDVTDIEYTVSRTLETIYGSSDKPRFIAEGNRSYEGKITLLQNDYEALVEEAKRRGGDDITDLEVSLIIAYIPTSKGEGDLATAALKTVVDRLVGVKFKSAKKAFSGASTTYAKIDLPFVALDIEHQI